MVHTSAKLDEDAHEGLVSILFTRSKSDEQAQWMNNGATEVLLLATP